MDTAIEQFTPIPLRLVGPLLIHTKLGSFETKVPLATFETPLWHSVARGAKVTTLAGGISTVILRDLMSRSIAVEASTTKRAAEVAEYLQSHQSALFKIAEGTSRFLRCKEIHIRVVGSCLFLRLSASCGDASGHNMITKASEALLQWICEQFPDLSYLSISGNFCTDKKVSSVNSILGRGKDVCAEVLIPQELCHTLLKATPEAIVHLNTKKNLLGSIINGGVASANAHFANMLLAIYLATGQDAANIVEGSQGITYAEVRGKDLYFTVSLPNIIVGTVGNGKHHPWILSSLEQLGCLPDDVPGQSSQRLAQIVAATVLCGELSLLAAQTNPGELVRTHLVIERGRSASAPSNKGQYTKKTMSDSDFCTVPNKEKTC
jgi:hydroxymethylglutaryl-CoA reductase (NADPH)